MRTCLLTLLLASLSAVFVPKAHASCSKFVGTFKACEPKVVAQFGQKIIREVKNESGKVERKEVPCKAGDNVKKVCGVGNHCVKPTGSSFSYCYRPGPIYNRYKAMMVEASNLCEPIFIGRQGGSSGYLSCIERAQSSCDITAINKCRALLKKEKPSDTGGSIIGFLFFLIASLLLEGLVLFGVLKLIDRHNPQNTIVKAMILGTIIGVATFPLVYISPLLGMLLSGSLLFGLIVVFYQQDVFLPAVYTAFHIVWVSYFFSFMVATSQLGNSSWLAQPKTLRLRMVDHHAKINEEVEEFKREQASRKQSAADVKEAKQKEKEEKKKEKENKKKDDDDDDND